MQLFYGSECETQEISNSSLLWHENYERAVRASIACENRQHKHGSVEYIERWLFEFFGRAVTLRYAGTHNLSHIYGYDWNDWQP